MQGKTVVITGGRSGIGEIAAQRLAQMGARMVLIARSKARGRVALARATAFIKGAPVSEPTDFAITAIHSLQSCIRRRKPPDARRGNNAANSS